MILDEVNHTHPCCTDCDMFILWTVLKHRNSTTDLCVWGAEQKRRRLVDKEALEGAALPLKVYYHPLEMVS